MTQQKSNLSQTSVVQPSPIPVPVDGPPISKIAPSSSNNVRASSPGWPFQPGNPGTPADVRKIVDARVIDASKIYNGGLSPEYAAHIGQSAGAHLSLASNTVQGPASIVELARALKNDPQLIFEFVYNNIEWQPGWGVMKGGLGCLLDGSGNAFDQSMLLVALLRQAGFTANYVLGQIRLTTVQYDDWFGTDSTFPNYYCPYWYAQYANIPCSAPVASGPDFIMDMNHVWVQVVISGTTYVLDPSRKTYTRKSPVANLDAILGYNATTFMSNAQSGATVDGSGNFVQNMNTTNIRADLTTMTSNLVSYIQNNAIGSAPAGTATIDDILGGKEIVPIVLPFTWQTTLSYEMPGDTPTVWTGDVPLAYKTTLQIQYSQGGSFTIDQTFTSDQLAATRLTLTFNVGLFPVLSLNGTVIQTSAVSQTLGTWESALMTVNHNAYAYQPPYPQWWQQFIYADTNNLYLVANAWGQLGKGQEDYHQTQASAINAAGFTNTEPVIGELMSVLWFKLVSQASRVSDLVGRLNSTNMNFFHQVGIVSNAANTVDSTASEATDIGGVRGFSSTLNFDFTQLARTNTVVAMHGVAMEAAALAQFTGISPGASTTTVIDKSNRTASVTIGGTVTVGNTLTLTVNDAALSGGVKSKTYTVVGGDTLTSIAAGITSLVNADTSLAAIGVTATSSGAVILISSASANQTTYSSSTSGGATETISIAFLKIYKGTSTNWNTGANVSAALVANGYNAGDMSFLYTNYLQSGINSVVLPDRPGLMLNNAFTGTGNWVFPDYNNNGGAIGLINNTVKGGKSVSCGFIRQDDQGNVTVGPPTCIFAEVWQEPPPPVNYVFGNKSSEPIGLFSGDYYYERSDFSVGSQAFPYGLEFSRFYSSRNRYNNGTLGWGWTHNHAMTAKVDSDGLAAMGNEFALQGAATIAQIFVAMDVAADTAQPVVKLVTMSIANKWWVDQIVLNAVIVRITGNSFVFVKQPNGTYTPSSELPSTLTLVSGLYTLTTPQGEVYNFNNKGRIASVVYPYGVTITYTYTTGLLTSITNGLGRTFTLSYTGSKLTSVSDGNGRTIQYGFDASDNLQSFTDAASNAITYQYDQPGRLTKVFLPLLPATPIVTNVYDSLSRVQTQANIRGQIWTYYFAGSRSEEVDPLTNSSVYYFNRFGRLTKFINALGFETTSEYDGLNRITKRTLPEGNALQATYDANNNILTNTWVPKPGSGLSNIQCTFTYDTTWAKLKTVLDGNGKTYTYGYDPANGNLLTITKPTVGGFTPQITMTYNGRGQLLTMTDETGIVSKLNYDASTEKLTSVVGDFNAGVGHLNLTTSLGYDTVGNINSVTDPNGNQTTAVYDNERRMTQSTSAAPFSYVTNIAYNVNGLVTSVQRQVTSTPTWQTVTYGYSISDKIGSITDPVGHQTVWTYDGADRVQTMTDAQGRLFQYAYDALNRISTVTDPTSTIADTETYTNNGAKKTRKDAAGNVTQYAYDGFDRPSLTTFADSSTIQFTSYDANSNLLTFVSRSGSSTTMTYDSLNRLSTKSPTGQPTVTYGYDLANRLTSISKPTVAGDSSTGTFQNFFDTAGRFFKEQYPDGKTVTHVLDSNGNRTKTTWPDGYFVTRSFDQLNRLTNVFLNGAGVASLTYSYDQLSRRSSVIMGNGANTSYTFSLDDDLVFLSNNFVGSSSAYSLSRNNIHQIVGNGVSNGSFVWHPSGAGTVSYGAADSVNKYPTVGGVAFAYDGNKNLTSDGTWTFSYDTENHLLSAVSGGVTASYTYDPYQRQSQKTVSGVKTQFIYDGLNLIATYDGSGNLQNRYVHGPGMDEPAIQVTAGGVLSYFHMDFQNSVVGITNNSGSLSNTFAYGPFGESTALSGTLFGYTGQRYDAETGLYYYKARYYSPILGRFLQTDPIGYAGGDFNLYAYVNNDPLNMRDPLGLSAQGAKPLYPLQGGVEENVNAPMDPNRFTWDPRTNPWTNNPNTTSGPSNPGSGSGSSGGTREQEIQLAKSAFSDLWPILGDVAFKWAMLISALLNVAELAAAAEVLALARATAAAQATARAKLLNQLVDTYADWLTDGGKVPVRIIQHPNGDIDFIGGKLPDGTSRNVRFDVADSHGMYSHINTEVMKGSTTTGVGPFNGHLPVGGKVVGPFKFKFK